MTATQMAKPGPFGTVLTEPFWKRAEDGKLDIQRCAECGHYQHYPAAVCRRCWSRSLTWQEATGLGTVWTFTVVGMPGHPAWQADVPYVLAIVELDEGPRLMTNIVGSDREKVGVGDRVRIAPRLDRTQPPLQFELVPDP